MLLLANPDARLTLWCPILGSLSCILYSVICLRGNGVILSTFIFVITPLGFTGCGGGSINSANEAPLEMVNLVVPGASVDRVPKYENIFLNQTCSGTSAEGAGLRARQVEENNGESLPGV
jgi:hypothetical protein